MSKVVNPSGKVVNPSSDIYQVVGTTKYHLITYGKAGRKVTTKNYNVVQRNKLCINQGKSTKAPNGCTNRGTCPLAKNKSLNKPKVDIIKPQK